MLLYLHYGFKNVPFFSVPCVHKQTTKQQRTGHGKA